MPLAQVQKQSTLTHFILREGVDVFRPLLNKLERGVTQSCIVRLNMDNQASLSQQLSTKPMFSRYYLVYAEVRECDPKFLEYLRELSLCRWVRLVITVRGSSVFDVIKGHPFFKDFRVLDCYNVTIRVMDAYIRNSLLQNGCPPALVTATAVTRIRRRAKYKAYVLDSVLPLLAKTNLSKRVVESHISPYTGVTLQNIGEKFFDQSKQQVVASYLLRYRRNISNIYKQVQKYISTWFELYDEYITGQFCDETVMQWIDSSGHRFGITQDYQAQKWLKSFSRYSYEFMCMVLVLLEENSTASNNIQLLTLYRIFKMVGCICA